MAHYSLNIEEGAGIWYMHVVELLGCFTRGHSLDEALQEIGPAIQRHLNWLTVKNQSPSSSPVKITWTIAEEIHDISQLGESGGSVALFKTDQVPVTQQMLDHGLSLMAWTRQDLLTLISPLPTAAFQQPIPQKRSIGSDLQHIANAEEWYISRLGPNADTIYWQATKLSEAQFDALPILSRLKTVRQAAVHTLQILHPTINRGIFTRTEYTNHPDELWTLYKVLRRFIEHEKEHIGTIQRSMGHLDQNR